MRITGMMQRHQVGAIEADIAGSLPDTLALLREPRLALLDRHPIELKDPAGQAAVKLSLSIPLQNDVRMDDIAIRAQAHLDGRASRRAGGGTRSGSGRVRSDAPIPTE